MAVSKLLTRLSTGVVSSISSLYVWPNPSKMALFSIFHWFSMEKMKQNMDPIGDTESAKRDWSYFTSDDQDNIHLGAFLFLI